MQVLLDKNELIRVLTFVSTKRKDPFLERIPKLSITNIDFDRISFGIPGVRALFSMSWDFFLEQKELLDNSENEII